MAGSAQVKDSPYLFSRKNLLLAGAPEPETTLEEITVLVANASHAMAKEITLQMGLALPGCSLIYAPTIEIARLVLKRRPIDLVISSPLLPDGSVDSIRSTLEALAVPPDLIVVGEKSELDRRLIRRSAYSFTKIRHCGGERDNLPKPPPAVSLKTSAALSTRVKTLGADIRNDLNNPLQEIVAMVFVAKSSAVSNAATELALNAIDKAAKNMALVVGSLEDKIRHEIGR